MSYQRTQCRLAFAAMLLVLGSTSLSGQTGSISGSVYDSIAAGPLVDAAVFLWNTPYRAETDSAGRYIIEGVPAGDYSLLFFHRRLGELGVSAGPRPITVEAGGRHSMTLATPSFATVVASQCLMEERPENAGAVAGRIFDAESGVAMGGAFLALTWSVPGTAERGAIELNASADGSFRSCSVPAGVPVLVAAQYYGRQNVRREFTLAPGGFERVDVPLHALRPSKVRATLRDQASGEAVEGAVAWLRGTDLRVVSDDDGHFTFDDVAPGTYMLMTDHLAYGTKQDTLVIPSGRDLTVVMHLDTRAIEIAPLTVTAETGVNELARTRGGIVITREQIDRVRQTSRDASDVIRSLSVPGVIVRHQSNGVICVGISAGQVKMNQNGCVEMMIYINDVRATDADLALRMPPDAIERMVIYKPVEAGSLFGLGGGNGVWAIYTRGNDRP